MVFWAKAKGIEGFGWGAATMLGRRIAKEGTLRNKDNVDVYSTIVIQTANKFGEEIVKSITRHIHGQHGSN